MTTHQARRLANVLQCGWSTAQTWHWGDMVPLGAGWLLALPLLGQEPCGIGRCLPPAASPLLAPVTYKARVATMSFGAFQVTGPLSLLFRCPCGLPRGGGPLPCDICVCSLQSCPGASVFLPAEWGEWSCQICRVAPSNDGVRAQQCWETVTPSGTWWGKGGLWHSVPQFPLL